MGKAHCLVISSPRGGATFCRLAGPSAGAEGPAALFLRGQVPRAGTSAVTGKAGPPNPGPLTTVGSVMPTAPSVTRLA
jgi:hypothetical protein